MSNCGKKGGIPKKFHTEKADDWARQHPDENYSRWIAKIWKELSDEKKKEFTKGRGLKIGGKCAPKKPKSTKKRNLLGPRFITSFARTANEGIVLKKLLKAFKKKNGKTLSSEKTKEFLTENMALFNNRALACYDLKQKNKSCDFLARGTTESYQNEVFLKRMGHKWNEPVIWVQIL
jgi:hypothetical protein